MSPLPAILNSEWDIPFRGPFDAFCVTCGDLSVFEGIDASSSSEAFSHDSFDARYFHKQFVCGRRKTEHHIRIVVRTDKRSMMKVGQHPSLADLATGEILHYTKFKQFYRELHRAVGLRAHGIGVGSYVSATRF